MQLSGAGYVDLAICGGDPLGRRRDARYEWNDRRREVFSGSDCGTTGSITKALPVGATGITVREPKVGYRDGGGGTRVTAVTLTGAVVTLGQLPVGPSWSRSHWALRRAHHAVPPREGAAGWSPAATSDIR